MNNRRRIKNRTNIEESRQSVLALARLLGCRCRPDIDHQTHPARGAVTMVHVKHDAWCPLANRTDIDWMVRP